MTDIFGQARADLMNHCDYSEQEANAVLAAPLAYRDQFAVAAMTGILASHVQHDFEGVAEYSYRMADAMMEERAKNL